MTTVRSTTIAYFVRAELPREPHQTLIWIIFHILQAYARHAGHLDIVRELADGSVGE